MKYCYKFAILATTCVCVGGMALPVAAQDMAGPTPSQASEDPYAAKGMPLGGFRLFPTLDVTANYDDNIYLTQTNTKSDYFFRETPQVMLQSDWSRHELDVYGAANLYQYASLSEQNHTDWDAGGDGRLDIFRGLDFSASGSYSVEHLANSSPDQPSNAKTPTEFAVTQTNAVLAYHPYHFGFSVGGSFTRDVYDATLLVGGTTLSNADRNEDQYTAFAKASYEFSPGYALFLQGIDNDAHYDLTYDRSGLQRDNNGYAVNVGLDMLVTDLVKGQMFVGYFDQRYKGAFTDVSGFNFGAKVDWFATPLWTFHLTASRTLNGTILSAASTEDDQSVQLSADFLARPNIVVNAYVGYLNADFTGSPRTDGYTTTGVKLTYHLNRWISTELSDSFQTRNSTITGQNFDDNVIMAGLKFQD
ncbi:MAG: outer membrane beta-barrel protein [Rhizomicrobium sp.]